VVKWRVVFAKHALKDAKKLSAAGLRERAHDSFQNPPPYEKLIGDLEGPTFPPH
jgi:toxin YoeB